MSKFSLVVCVLTISTKLYAKLNQKLASFQQGAKNPLLRELKGKSQETCLNMFLFIGEKIIRLPVTFYVSLNRNQNILLKKVHIYQYIFCAFGYCLAVKSFI